ncbi:MAG: ATP-grasp domain-containing protein [Alphaproteobacteria bacterium]|nr:MAG: ATP-grasp domain-containing protein [Alphaproteobacteria bacterium]
MSDTPTISARKVPHIGMPPMRTDQPPISHFEFWPPRLFYVPVALHWMWLSLRFGGPTLPTAANPSFPHGGLVGESKSTVFALMEGKAKERLATFTSIVRPDNSELDTAVAQARQNMVEAGLAYPVVSKPDMGCRGAGVKVVRSDADLIAYLEDYPPNARIILQQLIDFEPEAGVFFIRKPGEAKGRIFSLTLKYFPHVIGDGQSTLKDLIMSDARAGLVPHLYLGRNEANLDKVLDEGEAYRIAFAGSHSRGAIFRNGNEFITSEMTRAFNEVADGIPGFHFGRFDIRFPSIDDLQKGNSFRILEINGAGGEATHIWDSRTTLPEAYRTLRQQFRQLFEIGAANRRLGHKPDSLMTLYRAWRREGALTQDYPQTD